MARKTKIGKIYRWSALGLLALFFSFGVNGKAMANCDSFPRISLWSGLTHNFVLQLVDGKYDGDWGTYLAELELYENKLKDIQDKGLQARVTWRGKKVRLKGKDLVNFLKLFDQRLTVTRCLADNYSIANFSTAAGMSDGSNVMGSQESMQCRPVPQVKWWKIRTHESVASYVNQRYRGNWGAYIEDWLQRLAKVQDIFDRGAGAVTSTGVRLQGKTLSSYINQIQKQISVVRCLANKAVSSSRRPQSQAAAEKYQCPQMPRVSWWTHTTHNALINHINKRLVGNWSLYHSTWENHLSRLLKAFEQGAGVSVPKRKVNLEMGEIQRKEAVKGDKIELAHEDLGLYIPKVVQRIAIHKCLANEVASRSKL